MINDPWIPATGHCSSPAMILHCVPRANNAYSLTETTENFIDRPDSQVSDGVSRVGSGLAAGSLPVCGMCSWRDGAAIDLQLINYTKVLPQVGSCSLVAIE